jgi:MoaA/NifB/PqqE/SkfB family radical SAM enzyme
MSLQLAKRLMTEPDKRLLWKFTWNFGWKGMRAVTAFEKRRKQGIYFPAFLFISVTNACNLRCQGCWVTPTQPPCELDLATLDNLIRSCKAQGSYFFGILGGEPLLHKGLMELMGRHPECYFLLFTNGTLLTDAVAARLRGLGNVSPLISIEGLETVSDERRGGSEVYRRTLEGVEHCRQQRLMTGVATSVCQSNFRELVSERFLRDLIDRGVHYVWYYIYRPVGPNPCPDLKLTPDQIVALRQFMVDMRKRLPIIIVDAYWDHEGKALCPAATGIGHHISPAGYVEPCPPLQLAGEHVGDGTDLYERLTNSAFLREFRSVAAGTTRGCVIMERPDLLRELAVKTGATDSSGRGTMDAELCELLPCSSHHLPGREIPETSWTYRVAKKYWFFGFGAYG